jgi:outer membrane lipoprotein carrier protein
MGPAMTILFALFLQPQAGQVKAADATPQALLTKVQGYYDATRDLHARFEQTIESGIGGRPRKASGEVWLKKPGRMRWDYQKPEKKLMVADGKTLWVYEEEDAQAFRQDLAGSTLPVQVSFLVGEGKLTDEFEPSLVTLEGVGGPGDRLLKLVPKTATTAYRYLVFAVDPASGMVKETVIYDQQGGKNHLVFSAVEQNKGVPDAKFKFSPPAGVKVLTSPRSAAPPRSP